MCLIHNYYILFNVICFFIYCELIICFLGPCHYSTHFSEYVKAEYGKEKVNGIRKIEKIKVNEKNGKYYDFVVYDFIQMPEQISKYFIGKDFLFQYQIQFFS